MVGGRGPGPFLAPTRIEESALTDRIAITYGEFYDVPRMIRFECGGNWYFLRSYFDEELDDYSEVYEVYRLPFQSESGIQSAPEFFMELDNAEHLGQIAVGDIGLDESRRASIDAHLFTEWLASHPST